MGFQQSINAGLAAAGTVGKITESVKAQKETAAAAKSQEALALQEKENRMQKQSFTESAEVNKESRDLAAETVENYKALLSAEETNEIAQSAYREQLKKDGEFINEKRSRYTEGEKKGKFMNKTDKAKELVKRRHDLERLETAAREARDNLEALQRQKADLKDRFAIVNARNEYNTKTYKDFGYKSSSARLEVTGALLEAGKEHK